MIFSEPFHSMDLDGVTLRVETGDLGISVLDRQGETMFYLNAIGTTVLKHWLNQSFDVDGSWLRHPSVQKQIDEDT